MSIQNEPIDSGNATDGDKIAGIIEQTRSDIAQGNVGDAGDVLGQRLADASIVVAPDEFDRLLALLS